jgi:predicted O-methyltransferase YrrM
VYELYHDVIRDSRHYYAYDRVEALRARMLVSEQEIRVTDFGAGAGRRPAVRKASFIARRSATPQRFARLLFRLVNRFRPGHILEMGTSLGITTAYLAAADSTARVVTLEGCPETAAVAAANFRLLRLPNVLPLTGEFSETLPQALALMPAVDFAYFDGNHRREATMEYFEACLAKATDDSIFVFDDIHWSRGMEAAWESIRRHPRIGTSLDLYEAGIAFFHPVQAKQHFVLQF